MPATRSTAAAAITLTISLQSHGVVAQAATTTPAPASTDATPTGFYWPWENWTQPWATVIAGLAVLFAAFVTLIIAWLTRRQTDRHWTASNRQQRFIEAARQLADPNPAVRIAGTAAMETLTDDWLTPNPLQRLLRIAAGRASHLQAQQCVNVLTAYLRIPAAPPPDNNPTIREEHITVTRGRGSSRDRGNIVERHHHYTVNDDEVRATITRTIAAHVRKRSTGRSWSKLTYDFTGAQFHNANFTKSVWKYAPDFTKAVFTGTTRFRRARLGKGPSFVGAAFDNVDFSDARFGNDASFGGAELGDKALFARARFGKEAIFSKATFGRMAWFDRARFGDGATFTEAEFGDGSHLAMFRDARFGDRVRFVGATFGKNAGFVGATFGDDTRFDGATFGDGGWFHGATFGDRASFGGATFRGRVGFSHVGDGVITEATFGPGADFTNVTFELYKPIRPDTVASYAWPQPETVDWRRAAATEPGDETTDVNPGDDDPRPTIENT